MIATIALPRILRIGGGASRELPALLATLGLARPFFVTDSYLVASGLLDPLLEGRSDDGLQADERNVAESVAREEAAKKVTDPLLRESAAILGDAIGLLGKDAKLAAQVLPEARTQGHWVD